MKLKQITGTPSKKSQPAPTVSLGFYNGRIYFNPSTVVQLGLKAGDHIAFFQDEEAPDSWYFAKSKSAGSLQLQKRLTANALETSNSGIVRPLILSAGLHESVRFYISHTITEGKYWQILTKERA